MLASQDLFNFGVPSAKDADYLASNKMSDEEKQKLHLIQLISTNIRDTALANKSKTSETISNELIANIDMMNEIKQLLEEVGYDISLDVITTPFLPEKAVYTFHISWEM